VIISPNAKNSEIKKDDIVEVFAPGPTKQFDDFDYKYEPKRQIQQKAQESNKIQENHVKKKRKIQDRPTLKRTVIQSSRKNSLNGVPLGSSSIDAFDVIGGQDLFNSQGYPQDDR